jgi:hypothetical protein
VRWAGAAEAPRREGARGRDERGTLPPVQLRGVRPEAAVSQTRAAGLAAPCYWQHARLLGIQQLWPRSFMPALRLTHPAGGSGCFSWLQPLPEPRRNSRGACTSSRPQAALTHPLG